MSNRHPPWHAWYDLAVWAKRRRAWLAENPFCATCLAEGQVILAVIVDHVEPHKGDWQKFCFGRVQSLCKRCHDATKRVVELRGYDPAIGPDGMPLDRRHPIYNSRPRPSRAR